MRGPGANNWDILLDSVTDGMDGKDFSVTFVSRMKPDRKETLVTRVTSVGFVILALAVFKPLGIGALGWMVYVYLAALWVLGIGVCYVSEIILKYVVRLPASLDKGAEYIIRRNLWFQLINTPLTGLMVTVYFHAVMRGRGLETPLSWKGYFTILAILAFCSFAIGLYWRFKFRSRYLAAEMEEVRRLNENLSRAQTPGGTEPEATVTLQGSTNDSVRVRIDELLYIESVGNYVKVYRRKDGSVQSTLLRATMAQTEEALKTYPVLVRCHRAFLVNLKAVERVSTQNGNLQLNLFQVPEGIPVSRSHASEVKAALTRI